MRHARIVVLAAALALAAAANASGARPTLGLLDLTPVKVSGVHFLPGERVLVTLRAGTATRIRKIRASTRGAFTVNFGKLKDKDRCSGPVRLSAVGSRRTHTTSKLQVMACPAMTSDRYDP
jgi:hypothetical protein